ncbi:hypothetical protein CI610_03114 [invertebrate metagenome]|uniref:Uncharacterized protein n=1 Tax=invertebrate metagenome TaxID=1711999 RepID=A0A2H9T436_9ZZZZ
MILIGMQKYFIKCHLDIRRGILNITFYFEKILALLAHVVGALWTLAIKHEKEMIWSRGNVSLIHKEIYMLYQYISITNTETKYIFFSSAKQESYE